MIVNSSHECNSLRYHKRWDIPKYKLPVLMSLRESVAGNDDKYKKGRSISFAIGDHSSCQVQLRLPLDASE